MDAVFIRNSIMKHFEYVFRLKEINRRGGGVVGEWPGREITLRAANGRMDGRTEPPTTTPFEL